MALFCLTAAAGWLTGALGLTRLGPVRSCPGWRRLWTSWSSPSSAAACSPAAGARCSARRSASLLYAVARQGITLAGWDPQWFEVLLGVLLLVALLANGIVLRRLRAAPRS